MTPHEKYNLKTDVKSIRERMGRRMYHDIADRIVWAELGKTGAEATEMEKLTASVHTVRLSDELRSADLSLLCELAEKGERYKKAVNDVKAFCADPPYGYFTESQIVNIITNIIPEAEGEPR